MRRTINATLGHMTENKIDTKIYLTNTLAPSTSTLERRDQLHLYNFYDFSNAITNESYQADTWKTRRPIKVVIGNPPYNAHSENPYDTASYRTETDGITKLKERKDWLNNDYIKFYHFAEQIINANKNGGILAYV